VIGIEDWLRYVLGLIAVLGLIFLAARIFKVIAEGGLTGPTRRFRRLGVEEFLPLDGRRRLVLLRHDEREYLVLLGQQGETLLNVADRLADGPAAGAPAATGPAATGPAATGPAATGAAAIAAFLARLRLRSRGGRAGAATAGDARAIPSAAGDCPAADPDAMNGKGQASNPGPGRKQGAPAMPAGLRNGHGGKNPRGVGDESGT